MRRMREDHLHRNYSDVNERPIRCRAKLIQPKAGMAARLAMIPSAYNGTFCPATAASNGGSSERSSEGLDSRWALPGAGSFNRPTVREVVSNRTEQKNFKKCNEGRSISGYSNMLPTKTGAALSTLRQKYGDRPLLSFIWMACDRFLSLSPGRSSYLCRRAKFRKRGADMDQNVNYYGIILLLRQLRESGSFSEKELRRVAARIAADSGADIMISL